MRSRVQRHVSDLFDSGLSAEQATARSSGAPKPREPFAEKPDELTWHDYLLMLLHIGSEIEHGLMVQYLYAAYSLGGEQVPPEHREKVQRWRDSMVAIAKEEMGHLLSIQNLVCLLGGPISLDREDFPWDSPYYPFPFTLEPLSLNSLACYVYAEMPPRFLTRKGSPAGDPQQRLEPGRRYEEFEDEDKAKIRKAVYARLKGRTPHHVGKLYARALDVLTDRTRIPDSVFQGDTFGMQASWDDWGRGYGPAPAAQDAGGQPAQPSAPSGHEARVIVAQMATRTEAVAALQDIAGQGEAPHLRDDETEDPSHFDRFVEIYQGFERIQHWKPAREVAVNPTTTDPGRGNAGGALIEWKPSVGWAHLFNLRYRMLLTYLAHTYRLARIPHAEKPSVRGATMHRVFAEMYNLKTIAGILMRLPLRDPADPLRAGPPFQMPYTLTLPLAEADCWRLHQELLANSQDLCRSLLVDAPADGESYLKALLDLDRQSVDWTEQVLAGLGSTRRYHA
jgi:hypothetical protein